MQKAIIGKKVGMTQIFDESGKVIPVTVVEAGPCVVTQKKTVETDGYVAVQQGFGDDAENKLSKPEAGHLKKAGVSPKKVLKEFTLNNAETMNIGDEVEVKVNEIDSQGRINLIRNDITYPSHEGGQRPFSGERRRPPRRDGRPSGGSDRT